MKPHDHHAEAIESATSRWSAPTVVVLLASTLAACANLGVEPWERDYLAQDEMLLDGDPVDDAMDDHIYFSKEATSGSRGFAGGGCGCN